MVVMLRMIVEVILHKYEDSVEVFNEYIGYAYKYIHYFI